MAKESQIITEGTVTQVLPGGHGFVSRSLPRSSTATLAASPDISTLPRFPIH
jgi:hypothetical protein